MLVTKVTIFAGDKYFIAEDKDILQYEYVGVHPRLGPLVVGNVLIWDFTDPLMTVGFPLDKVHHFTMEMVEGAGGS